MNIELNDTDLKALLPLLGIYADTVEELVMLGLSSLITIFEETDHSKIFYLKEGERFTPITLHLKSACSSPR